MTVAALFAVDVGGTHSKYALINAAGEIVSAGVVDTVKGSASAHAQSLVELRERCAPNLPMAVAFPGPANIGGAAITEVETALADLGVSALVIGDMEAAGSGEADGEDIVLLQLGSGVGGAIVVGGVSTHCGIGHLVWRERGIPDSVGLRGTVEAYLGWHSLRRRALSLDPPVDLTNPAQLLTLAAEAEDARAVLEDALEAVGFAASVLIACTSVSTLVLSGGVSRAWGELVVEAARTGLDHRLYHERARAVTVRLSENEYAPLLGLWKRAQVRT
jgi:predicted NBD/HSP70 family sugar kinase